ncbi:MAG: hypothetical protein QM796_19470 [Chthoniobacteraceae bacterium]
MNRSRSPLAPMLPLEPLVTAELETDDEDGTSVSTLTFELSGLATDTYDVTITKKSDGSTEDLGTFDYPSTDTSDDGGGCDDGSGDGSSGGGDDNGGDSSDSGQVNSNVILRCDGGSGGGSSGSSASDSSSSSDSSTSEIVFGGDDGIALPSDFNALDVATVTITDSSSNVIFTGDFTTASSSSTSTTSAIKAKLNAHVSLTAGSGAPNASGSATFTAHSHKGKVSTSFKLSAQNVPGSSTFTVSVNGQDLRNVRSNRRGKLVVNGLTKTSAFSLRSVTVHNSQGTTIVKASF